MSHARRLTADERLAIVRSAAKGEPASVLARRFGVTPRTIQYTLKREKDRRRDTAIRSVGASVTVTPDEMTAFDDALKGQGIATRSDGLRCLMQATNGVFVPDEHLADELANYRSALNRVGNNVTQIAKRMNEANKKGMRPPFSKASVEAMRGLARFVLDSADEIDLLVRRRADGMRLQATDALRAFANAQE